MRFHDLSRCLPHCLHVFALKCQQLFILHGVTIVFQVISVTNVNDAQFSTRLLAQTTLRNVLGTKTLSEMLSERDAIANITEKVLDEGTVPWGVKVERVEIKDIRLPHQLTRSMAAEAEAVRKARAAIIHAEGEKNASR
ncbi:SPFH/Band 7/PHB domain protein [Ancylostoma duodenale]|uniref:SPFH/Band 7/PHB domain protein n=1 Tax=Ancylostoma duodenale TaxID=51022 RepID=A0A0C2FME0_9BILA|nr:SPFH/Band 7/PHB domain protein [Ancylostoma duodenale]